MSHTRLNKIKQCNNCNTHFLPIDINIRKTKLKCMIPIYNLLMLNVLIILK